MNLRRVKFRPRQFTATVITAVVVFVLFCLTIRIGSYSLSLTDVVSTVFGGGTSSSRLIVHELRMPRALIGVLGGLALGMSGAIVQSIARNPLASPDVLGITSGAGLAAVAVITLHLRVSLTLAALFGSLISGVLVYVLAWRKGLDGMRLVLIGVALSAAVGAIISWLIVRAELVDVIQAQVWLVGSLEGRTWNQVWPTLWGVIIAGGVALALVRPLKTLVLGDDIAASWGVNVNLTRGALLIISAVLAAIAVAATGPVAFVALIGPQAAIRLTGAATPPLTASALTGAALLMGADCVARTAFPVTMPVGILTAAIGGPFLVFLLVRQNRKASV